MRIIKPVRTPAQGTIDAMSINNATNARFVYLAVPKCASSSMKNYLRRTKAVAVKRDTVMKYPDRITVVRHPVARLISAYNFGWRKKNQLAPEFNDWWFHVKQNPSWDVHTQPMVEILGTDFSEAFQLEEIDLWWPVFEKRWPWVFAFGPMYHTNRTRRSLSEAVSLSQEVLEEIEEKYAEDVTLWQEAAV